MTNCECNQNDRSEKEPCSECSGGTSEAATVHVPRSKSRFTGLSIQQKMMLFVVVISMCVSGFNLLSSFRDDALSNAELDGYAPFASQTLAAEILGVELESQPTFEIQPIWSHSGDESWPDYNQAFQDLQAAYEDVQFSWGGESALAACTELRRFADAAGDMKLSHEDLLTNPNFGLYWTQLHASLRKTANSCIDNDEGAAIESMHEVTSAVVRVYEALP